jgi:hypothetical protein
MALSAAETIMGASALDYTNTLRAGVATGAVDPSVFFRPRSEGGGFGPEQVQPAPAFVQAEGAAALGGAEVQF